MIKKQNQKYKKNSKPFLKGKFRMFLLCKPHSKRERHSKQEIIWGEWSTTEGWGVTQWKRTCLAGLKPWVQLPVLNIDNTNRRISFLRRHNFSMCLYNSNLKYMKQKLLVGAIILNYWLLLIDHYNNLAISIHIYKNRQSTNRKLLRTLSDSKTSELDIIASVNCFIQYKHIILVKLSWKN